MSLSKSFLMNKSILIKSDYFINLLITKYFKMKININNANKHFFSNKGSILGRFTNFMKKKPIYYLTPHSSFQKDFYNFNKCLFARNMNTSGNKINIHNSIIEKKDEIKIGEEINIEELDQTEKKHYSKIISLETKNIEIILEKIHKRSKRFQNESFFNEEGSSDSIFEKNDQLIPEYLGYYNFLTANLDYLIEVDNSEFIAMTKQHLFEKFVNTIFNLGVKDDKTTDILEKFLSMPQNNLENACIVIYGLSKLNLEEDAEINLFAQCIKILQEGEDNKTPTPNSPTLKSLPKEKVIPLIFTLTEKEISNKAINEGINEFIKEKIKELDEYEISVAFKFYSKLNYYNYEILEIIIKKCIELAPTFPLKSILTIAQCLSHMKIRNISLLGEMLHRVFEIIQMNSHQSQQSRIKIDEMNKLDAEGISRILLNYVRLDFIELDTLRALQDIFFELIEREIEEQNPFRDYSNSLAIKKVMIANFIFMKKVLMEIKNQDIKDDKGSELTPEEASIINGLHKPKNSKVDKKKRITFKMKKDYKGINDLFFSKMIPIIKIYQEQFDFETISTFIIFARNLHITKRKILREFLDVYLFAIDFHINPLNVFEGQMEKTSKFSKIESFIKNGLIVFSSEGQNLMIKEAFAECKIDIEDYIYEKKENEKKRKMIKKESHVNNDEDEVINNESLNDENGEEENKEINKESTNFNF